MAETRGFEPRIRCYPYNGLANRRLQPLGHVSVVETAQLFDGGIGSLRSWAKQWGKPFPVGHPPSILATRPCGANRILGRPQAGYLGALATMQEVANIAKLPDLLGAKREE